MPINFPIPSFVGELYSFNQTTWEWSGEYWGVYSGQTSYISTLIAGTGISANTTAGVATVINTEPDQIVTISGGTGILTGGTYPNFTITNSQPDQIVSLTEGDNIDIQGTYPNFTITVTGLTDNDRFTTGFTYGNNTFTLSDNSGTTLNATINQVTGLTVNGNLLAQTISATTYQNLPTDVRVTGGTYSNGSATFTNNTGGTFNITGFFTGSTDVFVTGGTYSNGSATFTNNTGGTFNVSGFYTGETSYVNSLTTGTGLSGSSTTGNITLINTNPDQIVTISGGTGIVTGGTYPNFTITNSQPDQVVTLTEGNKIDVQGTYPNFTISVTGLTDNDKFTTGFTYNNNTFTLTDNSGSTLNATINEVTGLTVNGDLIVTGNTYTNNLSASTLNITSTPTINNNENYVLVRNSTTGDIERSSVNSLVNTNNTVTVALTGSTGVDFNSIKDAVNSITGATSANTYTVEVSGGVYYEDQFTIPSWVAVVGESSISTVIQANDSSQTLIHLSDQSAIFDCQIQGCTGTNVSAIVYSSSTTPQSSAISYVENVRFGSNYTHAKVVAYGGANIIMQCSNVKYGGSPFTVGFYATNSGSGVGRMQLRNVTSTNGGIATTPGLIFAKADAQSCGFIVNGCLLTKSVGAAAGTGFYVENGGFLRLTAVNFQRWAVGIDAPQIGAAPSIDAIALNFENNTIDVNIVHSGATGKIQGTDNFLKTIINQNAPLYEVNQDPKEITVAKKGGDFSSIKSAVDYLIASGNTSVTNRYVISVGPGEFYENEIDLTQTPYVSIVGSNIQTTQILPNTNTQHLVKIGQNNEISFLSFSGAPIGYAAIYCYDIGDFGQAHKCSFYDCDTNLWVESVTQDTKFYGEYLDYNGEYEYGTKVIGNNGYLALANIENYFNFPTGGNITYCNYATGSGATLNVFVGDNQTNGVSGSTAFYIQDSAELNTSTITVDGFTYGIINPNIGGSVRFDVDNASFVDCEWDLYVESINTFGTFGGSSNHEKIFTNSSDVYWAFLDINDGEFDITRKASVTFPDGSHTDFTTLIFEGGSMGLISGGTLSIVSGTTVQADGGFGYLEKSDDSGIVRRIDWINNQITLSANTDEYIFINENSVLTSSGGRPDTQFNILLGRVVTNAINVDFIDLSPFNAEHTSNRFGNLFAEALGPIYAFGSIVTEGTTPYTIDVTGGDYFFATNQYLPVGGTGITFTQYYRNGTGTTWITSATTLVNSSQYDNNGTLTGLTTGYFTKHTLYLVGDGSYENYFLVIGQNEYSSLVQAEGALLPTPPTYFSDSVTQIANIYIQEGGSGFTQVEDIRPTIAFRAGGVNASSVHGNLLGLGADDHTQYLLVSGARAMSGNLDMGANNITNVGTVDGVTVSAHASRHQFGGLDPVGTTTPSPNAIPYADVSGTLDSWVSTATTSTLGKVLLSTTPVLSSNPIVVGENDLRFLSSFTGGTYSGGTLSLTNISGGTYNVTGFFTGATDVFVTGGTYSNGTATFRNNTGGTFNVTGFTTGGTISGVTNQVAYFNGTSDLTGNNNFIYSGQTLQLKPTGTTSSDITFRISNSADTITNFSVNGLGYINTRINGTNFTRTLIIGGSNTNNKLDAGGYNDGVILGFSNTFSGIKNVVIGNSNTLTTSLSNSSGVVVGLDNAVQGVVIGRSNNGTGLILGSSNTLSEVNGNAQNSVILGNSILVTNSSVNNNTIFFGARTSSGNAYASMHENNFGIGGIIPTLTNYDLNARGVFYTQTGTAPTTLAADTFGMYSADITTGNAAPHFRTEGGDIVKLYTHSAVTTTQGIANALTTLGLLSASTISSATDVFVTGATYSNNTFTYTNNTGGTFGVMFNTVTGLTVNGNLSVTGTTSSGTISATTYQNLPTDVRVTGGTYGNGTSTFTNNTGGTFTVTGFLSNATTAVTLSSNVLSVTSSGGTPTTTTINAATGGTYSNGTITLAGTGALSTITGLFTGGTDVFVTGATYNNNTFTYTNNTGGTFSVNFSTVTGLTVNGNLTVTGTTSSGTISATTYQNLPTDIRVTGGTYSSGTAIFTNNTGGTFNVVGFYTGETSYVNSLTTGTGLSGNSTTGNITLINTAPDQTVVLNNGTGISVTGTYPNFTVSTTGITDNDRYVTGFTYNNSNTFTIADNSGSTYASTINTVTGLTSTGTITSSVLSATTYQNLPTDVRVTGGTYSNGTTTFTNNTGGTFNITGFLSNATTAVTLSSNVLSVTSSGGTPTTTTINAATGGTYSNGTITLVGTGTLSTITGLFTGNTDVFVTGGTYSNGTTTFTNNTGGTFNVSGFYTGETSYVNSLTTGTGLSGNSTTGNITLINTAPDQTVVLNNGTGISVTGTYPNFTVSTTGITDNDRYVTGFTYNNENTFTIADNSGSTYSATINTVTGLTSTGTISSNTISATTYQNLPADIRVTGGTYSSGVATFTNNTGGTFNVTGFFTGGTDVFVTGATYNDNTFTYTNNTGGTFSVNFNAVTGLTSTGTISSNTISATTYQNLPVDVFVTGGTYSSGSATFTNNTGGTFTVTGFSTGGGSFTGGTVTGPTNFTAGLTATTISATTYQNYPTQDLATTLSYGNNTGVYDIEMASNRVIKTDNGGGQIDLDFGGTANQVFISTDGGIGAESYLRMVDSSNTQLGTMTDFFSTSPSSTSVNWSNGFSLNGKYDTNTSNDIIVSKDNFTTSFTSSNNDMAGVIISSNNSRINSGIRNAVVIGGSQITANTSNTVFVPRLNINGTPTNNNSNTEILSRNSTSGVIEFTSSSTLSGSSVTGVTYSANTLSLNRNEGQTPLTATIGLRTKSGSVTAGSFAGTPRTATVTFTTAFANTNYSIQITGSDNRTFTYSAKATTGFTINTNANTALTGNVDWVAIQHGES